MNTRPDAAARRFAKMRLAVILIGGIVGVAAGLAAVYGIGTLTRNPDGDAVCRPALAEAKRISPLARGEVAAMAPSTKPLSLANLSFQDADGRNRTLAEWKGRVVLLNLWATWCVPCRKEMPALDALQKKLGGPAFEVVAVNIDTRDPAKPKAWLNEVGITGLTYYADPTAKIFQDLKVAGRAFGMPTTILVDRQGCELASLAGPAEWASDDAFRLVQAALAP
ncbi:MAG: TlpA family protein disulfide reductase [Rhizobiales bacterium]|nr:TlpA family protein disulfide reductase [Hyphomicrobiales bacterium]